MLIKEYNYTKTLKTIKYLYFIDSPLFARLIFGTTFGVCVCCEEDR
jgi:hypothetical protein